MTKVIIIDTSILNVWLKVPGKTVAGKNNEHTNESVSSYIEQEVKKGAKLVLPLTSVIETGNFIAHAEGNRKPSADELTSYIKSAADGTTPWLAFYHQNALWEGDKLKELADNWSNTVISESQSIGDAAIVEVAKYYATNFTVEIYTGDGGLKNYEYKIEGGKKKLRRERGKK